LKGCLVSGEEETASANLAAQIYISAEGGPEDEQQLPWLGVVNRFQLTLLLIRKLLF